jgi:hypothetical protein
MPSPNATAVRTIAPWQILAQVLLTVILVCAISAGQDKANFYIVNKGPSGWVCMPSKVTILEGDKKIVELDHKRYAAVPIEPGHHVFLLKHAPMYMGGPPKVELNVLPGQTYYLVADNKFYVAACSRDIKMVPKDEAEKLIAKMKPLPASTTQP